MQVGDMFGRKQLVVGVEPSQVLTVDLIEVEKGLKTVMEDSLMACLEGRYNESTEEVEVCSRTYNDWEFTMKMTKGTTNMFLSTKTVKT